jgi:hypothetical protein
MAMVTTSEGAVPDAPWGYASRRWAWVLAGLLCVAACGIGDDGAPQPTPTAALPTSTSTVEPPSTPTASPALPATATHTPAGSPTHTAVLADTRTQPPATLTPASTSPPTPVASAVQTQTPRPSTPTPQPACSVTPGALPFDRTECRPTCAHYDPLKQVFFGETHLHTAYSFDASTIDTRNLPADAYRYAKGGMVGLPPWADTRGDTSAAVASEPPR